MTYAICDMNNCRNRAPADEAFCARHRRKREPNWRDLLTRAREYVADSLDAHEHSDGRKLLTEIDEALP